MRIYTSDDEERIYLQKQARDWRRSGFINDPTLAQFEKETASHLARTNLFFRILLLGFTSLAVGAMVALIQNLTGISPRRGLCWLFMASSIPSYFLAEEAVRRFKFYRHGIEEALALSALVLFCAGFFLWIDKFHWGSHLTTNLCCSVAALAAGWLYHRFGFLYAYFMGVLALAVLPFQFSLSPFMERAVLFGLLAIGLTWNAIKNQIDEALFQKAQNQVIQAVLFIGLYLTVNLRLTSLLRGFSVMTARAHSIPFGFTPVTYYATYALTWLLPILALSFGVRAKKRGFIDAGLITLIITIATNKDYLGIRHYSWDPAMLGIVLIGAAVAVIRFLNSSSREERYGFTSRNILKSENTGLELAAAAVIFAPSPTQPSSGTPHSDGGPSGGGLSGGGGAERKF